MNAILEAAPPVAVPERLKNFATQKGGLAHQLSLLGIVPFDKASVERYKAKRLKELKDSGKPGLSATLIDSGFAFAVLCFFAGVSVYCFKISFLVGAIVSGACLSMFPRIWTDVFSTRKDYLYVQAAWLEENFETFCLRALVPQRVQDDVEEIQVRLPNAEAKIHYLYADPFVEIKYKDPKTGVVEEFLTHFWNEKGFVG